MQYKIDPARIAQRLKAVGLSRAAASRLASPTGSADLIRDIERGKSGQIRGETAAGLTEVLECDLEYLTGEQDMPRRPRAEDPRPQPTAAATVHLSDAELEIIALMRAHPGKAASILSVARTLAQTDEPSVDSRGRLRSRNAG